jgi:hypothetical protein
MINSLLEVLHHGTCEGHIGEDVTFSTHFLMSVMVLVEGGTVIFNILVQYIYMYNTCKPQGCLLSMKSAGIYPNLDFV